ncbi:hypothetical protein WICMUC_001025 [Wickerhamomyces mucosus]|uniref:Uncharacterized protein n=1 Tax=Wickerhamomyces mucosus TaxID=1378264 RepID=A0A9P8PXH0_9ASCO|nr:hypothetical protein WICMUC_001025 [Wickerhamomyces mucosus]
MVSTKEYTSQTTDSAEPTKDKKQRPRPASLDLSDSLKVNSNNGMGEFAIKCISPGLPSLSAKMKSTVLISKSIEAQQRQIIASRNSTTDDVGNDDDEEEDNDDEIANKSENIIAQTSVSTVQTPSTSGLSATMENLSIPSERTNKRLRRDKAPPPLNLSQHANLNQIRPTINSAPIYNAPQGYYTPATTKRARFKIAKPVQNLAVNSRTSVGPSHMRVRSNITPLTPYDQAHLFNRKRRIPNTANPYGGHFISGRSISSTVPKSAILPRNPLSSLHRGGVHLTQQQLNRYQQQLAYQQYQWDKFKEFQNSSLKLGHVADVFHGNATRYAPLVAQPLSAQRQFFEINKETRDETIKKANNDEIIAEDEEEGEKAEEENDDDDDDGDDVENNAIEPDAKIGLYIRKQPTVRAEIRLANNIFKFDFERLQNSPDNDKERFLNHCTTVWDEFNKLT